MKILNVTAIEKYLPDLFYEITLEYQNKIKRVVAPELWWRYRRETVLNTVISRWDEFQEI